MNAPAAVVDAGVLAKASDELADARAWLTDVVLALHHGDMPDANDAIAALERLRCAERYVLEVLERTQVASGPELDTPRKGAR